MSPIEIVLITIGIVSALGISITSIIIVICQARYAKIAANKIQLITNERQTTVMQVLETLGTNTAKLDGIISSMKKSFDEQKSDISGLKSLLLPTAINEQQIEVTRTLLAKETAQAIADKINLEGENK